MAVAYYLGNKILDAVFKNTSLAITTAYISLHTGDPGLDGSNEVTGGSYVRKTSTFSSADGNATANTAAIEYAGMPAATVTHVGVWDAESGGNYLWGAAVTASKTYGAGDVARLSVGSFGASVS